MWARGELRPAPSPAFAGVPAPSRDRRRVIRVCPPAFAGESSQGMPKVGPEQFSDVVVERATTITGGLMKRPLPVVTKMFQVVGGQAEFIHLVKGADWLTHSACGPTNRQ